VPVWTNVQCAGTERAAHAYGIHPLQADLLHDMTRNAAAGFVGGLVGVAVLATIGLAIRGARNHK
jgi:hypothetical protein